MNGAAKFVFAAGIMAVALSVMLMPFQPEDSPERLISWINLGVGALMVLCAGAILARAKWKKQGTAGKN